jgi:hypothetical protein
MYLAKPEESHTVLCCVVAIFKVRSAVMLMFLIGDLQQVECACE